MKKELDIFVFHGILSCMIERSELLNSVRRALKRSRVVCLLGPRQCGKTTLARQIVDISSVNYFDLEDPSSLARLDQPMLALQDLRGVVVIDEVQRRPDLFPILRVLADRSPVHARFLILGSASPGLLRQSSESLAGRIELVIMGGLSLAEVGVSSMEKHWLRGGFPRSFLARSNAESMIWRKNLIQTFVERDLPQLGISIPAVALLRFWTMLAHFHGQVWNAADPARSMGISEPTVRRYLDVLSGVFMVRQLKPWHANINKRQVKSPKVYLHDSGLLHQLLGIRTVRELYYHPRSGASWEGYVIEEVIRATAADDCYFWRTHTGAEIDLLLTKGGHMFGVECKRVDAPRLSPSMRTAIADLPLQQIAVIYPGSARFSLAKDIVAVPLAAVAEGMKGLFARRS